MFFVGFICLTPSPSEDRREMLQGISDFQENRSLAGESQPFLSGFPVLPDKYGSFRPGADLPMRASEILESCESMDRLWPARRPPLPVAGYHTWLDLSFLHWRVPADLIAPMIPRELTLDTWEGDALLAVVPFHMRGIRPWFLPPIPGASAFAETNLRTYVHYKGRDPGIIFFSLDAAKWLAVMAARIGWLLPYHWAEMSVVRDEKTIRYTGRRKSKKFAAASDIHLEIGDWIAEAGATAGTLEHFVAERYILYTRGYSGKLLQGFVHHRPYPLRAAKVLHCRETLSEAAGISLETPPFHVCYSPGVKVEVFQLGTPL